MTNKRLIELYNQGYSLRDIARLAGVTFQNVHQRLTSKKARVAGVLTRGPHDASTEEAEVIKRLYVLGMPAFEISSALGLSDMAISRRLAKMAVRRRNPAESRDIKRLPIPDELVKQVEKLRAARDERREHIELTNVREGKRAKRKRKSKP